MLIFKTMILSSEGKIIVSDRISIEESISAIIRFINEIIWIEDDIATVILMSLIFPAIWF